MHAQADLGLRSPHMPKDTFLHCAGLFVDTDTTYSKQLLYKIKPLEILESDIPVFSDMHF